MGGWSGVGWIWELCPGAGCGRETGMDENMELSWERSKMAVVKVGHWNRFEVLVSGRRDIRLWLGIYGLKSRCCPSRHFLAESRVDDQAISSNLIVIYLSILYSNGATSIFEHFHFIQHPHINVKHCDLSGCMETSRLRSPAQYIQGTTVTYLWSVERLVVNTKVTAGSVVMQEFG